MPCRRKSRKRAKRGGYWPRGTYMMLDVGRPGSHYQFVQKVDGWRKASAPKRLLRAGWVEEKKGYVRRRRR